MNSKSARIRESFEISICPGGGASYGVRGHVRALGQGDMSP